MKWKRQGQSSEVSLPRLGGCKALLAVAAELISERNKEPERQRSRTACKTPAHGWPGPPKNLQETRYTMLKN